MGTPQEDYLALELEYDAIAEADFIKQFGSHEQIMPYAHNLAILVSRHSTDLIDEGLAASIVSKFPLLINGYDVAASLKQMTVAGTDGIESIFKMRKAESEEIYENLMIYGEKAFAGHPELLKKLADIRKGKGYDNLAKDLIDLYTLFNANRDKFASYKKFNPEWINRAADLHVQFLIALSLKRNPEKVVDHLKIRERQAMTALFMAIKAIREYGELAWRNQPELLAQLKFSWTKNK